ncbi:MAG: hypothetical protein IKO23_09835 [Bacteroidales bacterium]|nr:hypothetical protein [Bacteroidales bacterium]
MNRPPTAKEWQTALRLLERLTSPSGTWRDDETKRITKQYLKKWKSEKKNSSSKAI